MKFKVTDHLTYKGQYVITLTDDEVEECRNAADGDDILFHHLLREAVGEKYYLLDYETYCIDEYYDVDNEFDIDMEPITESPAEECNHTNYYGSTFKRTLMTYPQDGVYVYKRCALCGKQVREFYKLVDSQEVV